MVCFTNKDEHAIGESKIKNIYMYFLPEYGSAEGKQGKGKKMKRGKRKGSRKENQSPKSDTSGGLLLLKHVLDAHDSSVPAREAKKSRPTEH